MSRYYSRRNKAKVWRQTYGKKYIARRALKMAQVAIAATTAMQQVRVISPAFACASAKAAVSAECLLKFSRAVAAININEGFVIKGK